MKIASLLTTLLLSVSVVFSQVTKDPKATAILDKVNKKFHSLTSFKAEFSYIIESKATGQKESIKGDIAVKGSKYLIKTDDGREVYNNGVSIWNFFVEDNEVNIYENEEGEDSMSPTAIADMYKKGYKYVLQDDVDYKGKKCKVIDLEPDLTVEERKSSQVYKIRIFIDPVSDEIMKWKIFEKNGNRYTMEINKFSPNVPMTDATFVFDKSIHPGVVVEDMR